MRLSALLTVFTLALAGWAQVTITPLPAVEHPTLPLPVARGDFWQGAAPLWQGGVKDIDARAWVGANAEGLRFHVVVTDPIQKNEFTERNLWRGDCLYLGIDGRADDTQAELTQAQAGLDDATFIIGLGGNGPENRVSVHGDPAKRSLELSPHIHGITRDDAAKATTYDFTIPYTVLNLAPGQSPAVGVALTVAHKNEPGDDVSWGRFRGNRENPRLYSYFSLPEELAAPISITPRCTRVVTKDGGAEAVVAVKTTEAGTIVATLGVTTQRLAITGAPTVQRYLVRAEGGAITPQAATLAVAVTSSRQKFPVEFPLETPTVALAKLDARCNTLTATATQPLAREHLRAIYGIAENACRALAWDDEKAYTKNADYFLDVLGTVLRKLPAERFDWDLYLRQGRPFVVAFVSDYDRTLQYCTIQLPYGWQPEQAYPMTVYLHGSVGNVDPLTGLFNALDSSHQDTLFREEDMDPNNIPAGHRGFIVAPWARGNSMYEGVGEYDVWQSIDIVKERFKVDEDRQYMTGFSMGCNGAWALAARTPWMWAGINTASGFGVWSATNRFYLAENVKEIPIINWVGDLDNMAKSGRIFQSMLEQSGNHAKLEVAEKTPHTYPYTAYMANLEYLMQFTRKPPANQFTYIVDSYEHQGRNGVSVYWRNFPTWDRARFPRITCQWEGQQVTLTTQNANALTVDLGPNGLNMAGEVTITWNGKLAYTGPVKRVNLEWDKI